MQVLWFVVGVFIALTLLYLGSRGLFGEKARPFFHDLLDFLRGM